MTEILYEHPLNEKMRTYLRLEHLHNQLQNLTSLENEWQQQAFFNVLFEVIDVLDRNDIRPELIKDCERTESALVAWSKHPSVSDDKLTPVLQQAVRLQSELLRNGKLVGNLKDDKFLAPLRQRFAIPGGTCYFDVPQLHYWFNLAIELRQPAAQQWCSELSLVQQAVSFILGFTREKGAFVEIKAKNGFYQSNTEQHELLRIRYTPLEHAYPTVSGNKYRYAIRFMQLCEETGRSNSDKHVSFQLACC
ncbi:cell division protein ZapD [Rheinheimera baltica]|uniref:cell division protein ZapD n=1 Tax=Rheinheimera baltica TaxID=67576 RepID=UPI0004006EEB|nr:cell division protein ZapD [Rheinheimera baltica]MDP5142042.1 cell division protein ZapD [Rheinheimera baltica]MDP5150585.1 cell division protein ZapD [Rheinheimera baltica]MDP5190280.1 cell division protein ZapD [Rheinheimera baltica]